MSAYSVSALWVRLGLAAAIGGVAFLVLSWGIRDLDLIAQGKVAGNSISRVVQDFFLRTPPGVLVLVTLLIVAPIFFLLGHLLWPQYRPQP